MNKLDIEKIKGQLNNLNTTDDKLEYLFLQKKDLARIIHAFENTDLRKYTKANNNLEISNENELGDLIYEIEKSRQIENCPELNLYTDFIYDEYNNLLKSIRYKNLYRWDIYDPNIKGDDMNTDFNIELLDLGEHIRLDLKIYKKCENYVLNEIDYLSNRGRKLKDTQEEVKRKNSEQNSNGRIDERMPTYGFDFDKVKSYAYKLTGEDAILYLNFVLKEFDREKRENSELFMTKEDIEYFEKNFERNVVVTDLSQLDRPPELEAMGRSARISLAKENFEKNVKNEIEFIEKKHELKDKNIEKINFKQQTVEKKEILSAQKMEKYIEYGKECFKITWNKNDRQNLEFSKMMEEQFGNEVLKFMNKIWDSIQEEMRSIELIGLSINQLKINFDNSDKLKNRRFVIEEIKKVKEYSKEIKRLEFITDNERMIDEIPDNELEQYDEWQSYYINKIPYDDLIELLEFLRKNRPKYSIGHDDFEYYNFKRVPEHVIEELGKYLVELENLFTQLEQDEKQDYKKDDVNTASNELAVAHGLLIRQRNRIKILEKGITKTELEKIIYDNKCRFKNGKINYSALGKILGCTHHTAKSKCKYFGIS